MRNPYLRPALLAASLAAAAAAPAVAAEPAATAGSEVIVQLRSATAAGQLAPDALVAAIDRLSQQVGLPLTVVRLGSGGEIVLAADRKVLAERMARAAGTVPGVRASPSAEPAPRSTLTPPIQVAVEPAPGTDMAALSEAVAREIRAPVSASVRSGRVVVTLDPAELGPLLAQRLKALPEVEYAQPNYMVRPQGAASSL